MNLRHHTMVITGGSSGIGLQLAKVLSADNQVIICGRSQQKLEQAKRQLPNIAIYQCDLAKAEARENFYSWVKTAYPRCNMLINNAAIVHKNLFVEDREALEKVEREMATNFIAPVALTKLFVPLLIKNPTPTLVYITTGLVYAPRAVYPVYCATKAALHSFVQTLRYQLKGMPITAHEVLMPAVDTPWHQGKPPKIAIPVQRAVAEMCQQLSRDQEEIKVGGAKLLYQLARFFPKWTLKQVNRLD